MGFSDYSGVALKWVIGREYRSSVEETKQDITVKSKDGKKVTVSISGSRTSLDGIKSRSEFKEGQSVTVE